MKDSDSVTTIDLDVAILGGGFAGVYCAKALGKGLGKTSGTKVGLISDENYLVFQPMLPEVAGGSISPRHVVNPLRLLCRHVQVLKGQVESIDWPRRYLDLNAGPFSGRIRVRYRHLVLTLGAVIDLSGIPGMPEHAFLLQNVGDAMYLRSTIISRIEEANLEPREEIRRRLLSFVVVGGGYSGVETAGQILDLFRSIHHFYPNISFENIKVHLVHSRNHLLPNLSQALGDYSAKVLKNRGLNLVLNQRVQAVTANRVCLSNGGEIDANTVVSTVGNAPHPLILKLAADNGLKTEGGRVYTNASGEVLGQPELWAAGDCAAVPLSEGGTCPANAQFAIRQGRLVGRNILRQTSGQPLETFSFQGFGELASIGHHTAVANILGFQFSGFFAWWLWRTVYLLKLPRLDRKIRVMLDWTFDLFFPRDINLLSPRYSKLFKEIFLQEGDLLYQAGEPAFSFYIIKSGAIEIFDEKGVVKTVLAGEYFGERALLDTGFWLFNARAAKPTQLVSISANIFYQMVRGCGSLSRLFSQSANRYQSREAIESLISKIAEPFRKKTSGELMQRKVKHLHTNTPLEEALQYTHRFPHSYYPVLDDDNRLQGVVHRDDLYEFLKQEQTSSQSPVGELSLGMLPSIPSDLSVEEMVPRFIRSGYNKMLVIDQDHRLEGIISLMDILGAQEAVPASSGQKNV